jgi:hypothetical protein
MSVKISRLVFNISIASILSISSLAISTSAFAAPKKDPAPTPTTPVSPLVCSLNNISIGGTAATNCKGPFDGNDTGAGNPLLTELNNGLFNVGAGVTWTQAGKSDGGANPYGFTADNGSSSGDWGLGKSFVSDELTGLSTFVISLKTSTKYSAYLFQDIDLSKTGLAGVFNTLGVALDKNSNGKDLSHASLFIAKKPSQKKVPEPSIIFALSAFAAGSLAMKKKSSNSALQA